MAKQIPEIPGAKIYYVRLPDYKNSNGRGIPILTVAVAPSRNGQNGLIDRATAFCPPLTVQGRKNPDYPPVKRKGRMIALGRLVSLRENHCDSDSYSVSRMPAKTDNSWSCMLVEKTYYYNSTRKSFHYWSNLIPRLISNNGIGLEPTRFERKLLKITHENKEEEK